MPTPRQGYYLDGVRIPSVTTIVGRFKDSGALIKWAYGRGREHELMRARGEAAPASLYEETSVAADIGTQVHALVDDHIHGRSVEITTETDERIRSAFNAYMAWERNVELQIVDSECQLISREHHYGGTPDAIGHIDGVLCLVDWKTSNAVYSDYLVQLAAYRHLWNENHADNPLTGGSHLLRFSKENGDFAHHYYPDLSDAWEQFLLFRRAYEIDKKLTKRAA